MKKQLFVILFALMLCGENAIAQQEAQFSQYMFNGVYLNPAYAGFQEALKVNTFYRAQWAGFNGAPSTFTVSVDAPIKDNRMGVGVVIASDQVGLTNENSMYAVYSYKVPLTESSALAFGMGAGLYRFSISPGTVIDLDDPLFNGGTSSIKPDLKFGVLFYTQSNFYIGISASNLLSPYISSVSDVSSLVPVRSTQLYFTGGIARPLNENFVLKPSFMYKQGINGTSSLDINAFLLMYDRLWIGASYRSGFNFNSGKHPDVATYSPSALIFLTDIFIQPNLSLGYAYDLSLSYINEFNTSAHELTLTYIFKKDAFKGLTSTNKNEKDNRSAATKKNDAKEAKELDKKLEQMEREAEKNRQNGGGMANPRYMK